MPYTGGLTRCSPQGSQATLPKRTRDANSHQHVHSKSPAHAHPSDISVAWHTHGLAVGAFAGPSPGRGLDGGGAVAGGDAMPQGPDRHPPTITSGTVLRPDLARSDPSMQRGGSDERGPNSTGTYMKLGAHPTEAPRPAAPSLKAGGHAGAGPRKLQLTPPRERYAAACRAASPTPAASGLEEKPEPAASRPNGVSNTTTTVVSWSRCEQVAVRPAPTQGPDRRARVLHMSSARPSAAVRVHDPPTAKQV